VLLEQHPEETSCQNEQAQIAQTKKEGTTQVEEITTKTVGFYPK